MEQSIMIACIVGLAAGLSMLADPAHAKTVTVALDGSGDCKTVAEAVAMMPDQSAEKNVIHIKAGRYDGQTVIAKTKSNISFEGEGADKTILTWAHNVFEKAAPGVHSFNPCVHLQADNCRFSDLTIENASGDRGQALAMLADGDRAVFENCRLLGWQDTLMVNNGPKYFHNCYIEGRVDFIYGSATAVFDSCEIHSKNGGFVTAASTPPEAEFGLVFLNCKLTGDPNPWIDPGSGKANSAPGAMVFLGRPWRANAAVAYINCVMGDHVRPEGWNNWDNRDNEKTARFAEFGSKTPDGKPVDLSKRVPWAKKLTAKDAARYTLSNILTGGWNDWDPTTSDGKHGGSASVVCRPGDAKVDGSNAKIEDGGANIGYWSNIDTKVSWQPSLPAGTYRIGLTYALDQAGVGCTLQVQVGDKKFKYEAKPTGGWSTYKTVEVGRIQLRDSASPSVVVSAIAKQGNFVANLKGLIFAPAK